MAPGSTRRLTPHARRVPCRGQRPRAKGPGRQEGDQPSACRAARLHTEPGCAHRQAGHWHAMDPCMDRLRMHVECRGLHPQAFHPFIHLRSHGLAHLHPAAAWWRWGAPPPLQCLGTSTCCCWTSCCCTLGWTWYVPCCMDGRMGALGGLWQVPWRPIIGWVGAAKGKAWGPGEGVGVG